MAYGELKVDSITFTDGGSDATVSVSGLVKNPTFSGDIIVNGNISGTTITGDYAGFGSVTGVTVTGTTANFVSGVYTTQISGATITGDAGQFTALTGGTAGFTTVTGTTVTGTTANFVSGVYTTQISGATITGDAGNFTTATVTSGVFASGTAAAPSVSVGTTDNGLYSPGTDQVALATNGTGRLFVDSSGNLLIGTSSGINVGGGANAIIQAETTSQNAISLVAHRGTNTSGSIFVLAKSRGTSAGSTTIVANDDELGAIRFAGADGIDIESRAASVAAFVDGTPGTNSMPGRLVFSTTPTGSATPTERARIDSSGRLLVGTSSQAGGSLLQVNDNRIRIASSKTPASAADTGTAGEVCWDSSYIYVCTATDTWKRAALSTW